MDSMKPTNILRSNRGPIFCLLWLFSLATFTSGAATGVNRFSAFSQPVGPFTVIPDDEEIVVRLPPSHSSVRNFGGGEAPRAQQNSGIPLSFSPQGNGFNHPSPARAAQEPNHSPKFFVLNEDSNGNNNGRINAAVRSHFVAPGSQPRGIPLNAGNQVSSNGQRSSTAVNNAALNNAQAHNPSSRFFVLQDDDLNINVRANSARSNGFRGTTNGNIANHGVPLQLGSQGSSFKQQPINSAIPSNGFRGNTNGNRANQGVPLPLGNQGNSFRQQAASSATPSNSVPQSSNPSSTFFVVENSAEVEDNLAIMSLGRRFHPNGIPIISNPVETPVVKEASQKTPEVQSPFLLTPNSLFVLKDESLEDLRDVDIDEQKIVVDLSPMVKSHNHNTANERLSLSSNFLNQYNFVDVKGSTSFGYKTDDQYQDHVVHRSGKHEGKFGWTAPEGSKHHIEYIADEKGYRVITSSGIYLNDEASVKEAKDNHFGEHKKVLENLASMKRNNVLNTEQAPAEQSGTFGIPLPDTMINEQRESSATGPQPGFVVIESDYESPLISQDVDEVVVPVQYPDDSLQGVIKTNGQSPAAFGDSTKFGIPLPKAPVRAEGSPMEPSQPINSQGGNQFAVTFQDPEDVIVPIQYPVETFGGDAPIDAKPVTGGAPSSPAFGVPIPKFPAREESAPMEPSQSITPQGGNQFAVTFQDPEDVIVPIQYPVETFGGDAPIDAKPVTGGAPSSSAFGVPIPKFPAREESAPMEPSQSITPQGGNKFAVTFQDPEDVIVPIQYPVETFGGDAPIDAKPVAGGAPSSPAFGVPIPKFPVREESIPMKPSQSITPQGVNQFGIIVQDPEDVIVPIQYPVETFGVEAPINAKPVAGGTSAFGVPIPEIEASAPVRPSQPTSFQDVSQFGIVPQDSQTEMDAAAGESQPTEAAARPEFPSGNTETSQAEGEFSDNFDPIIMSETPVEPLQPIPSQGESQFGITPQEFETTGETEAVAQPAVPSGTAETSLAEEEFSDIFDPTMSKTPVEPSQPFPSQGESQFGIIPQESETAWETEAVAQPAVSLGTAETNLAEEEFSDIFGPLVSSGSKDTTRVPGAVTVESPKLSVKIGLEETTPNKIQGFGLALPSPTQTDNQNLNPITGTGGFTVISEDKPFIALNNIRDNVAAEPERNSIPSRPETSNFNEAANNFSPGGNTFSNQFFVVSPTNANHGIGLFPDNTANQEGSQPSDLLQGPPFANKEKQNLIRRRS